MSSLKKDALMFVSVILSSCALSWVVLTITAPLRRLNEINRITDVERGAENDASEFAISEHRAVSYVRCHLRPEGYVSCRVHTSQATILDAICRARRESELLVDRTRCSWTTLTQERN